MQPYVSPAEERLQKAQHHQELASKTPDDLQALKDRLTQLQTQRDRIKADIAATEEQISQKRGELNKLEGDTFADIDKRVKGCLETSKAIELLESRLTTLKTMLADTEEAIAPIPQQIAEIERHFEYEAYTVELERFITEEFLPSQQAHAEVWRKLNQMLQAKPHYLTSGTERLEYPGDFYQLIDAGGRVWQRRNIT